MKKHGKLLLKYLLLFVMTVFVMGYCCISFSIITDLLRGILYRIHILLSTCEKQQFASNLRLLVTVNIMNNDETVTLFAVPHMIGL